jgi:beta-glucosidase
MKTKWLTVLLAVAFISCNHQEPVKTYKFKFQDPSLTVDERINDLVSQLTLDEKISLMMNNNPPIERLGIERYEWWGEGGHGVSKNGQGTVFPQSIGLAATFDEDLMYRVATAISDEARAKYNIALKLGNHEPYSGITYWSPNINIFRDPRWGRGQETYGEDPFLTGKIGVAYTKGMQGDDPKYMKIMACAKHYAAHSGPEFNRTANNAHPPKKDLFETYLPAFKMLVQEGHVESVMCAYSRLYDMPCCGSDFLLKEVLLKGWNFKGHIVTDCGAISAFFPVQKVTKSPEESAALAINSGVNLDCGDEFRYLAGAVKQGLVSEKTINERLSVLLRTLFKLGMFDPKGMNPYDHLDSSVVNSEKNRALAREAAAKSVVLLKNKNNILPLRKDAKKYFVVGPSAANLDVLIGSYYAINNDMKTILEGIMGKVSLGSTVEYTYGFLPHREVPNPLCEWHFQQFNTGDAIIVVAGISGLMEGEEGETVLSEMGADRKNIDLPQNQIDFIKRIRKNGNKPIVLVLTSGSPLILKEAEELADAVVLAWYPGEEGGNGVADVLFGDFNPCGRLPLTFPKSIDNLPAFDDYSMKGRTYRYMKEDPFYPFGFGLSYTTFEYSNITVDKNEISKGDSVNVTTTITNKGSREGEEVAQLYLTQKVEGLEMPNYSLKGFKHVNLKPGESKQISFKINPETMMVINNEGESILAPGKIKITIGGSCPSGRSVELGSAKPAEIEFDLK